MFTTTGTATSVATECTRDSLPSNIITPQRPFFPETDTVGFGDIGLDPAATPEANQAAFEQAYEDSCVALQDPIPVVSSGTQFQGISDSSKLGHSPFYIDRGPNSNNQMMAYTWVPDGWQMRGTGDVEILTPPQVNQVLFAINPGVTAGFAANGATTMSFDDSTQGLGVDGPFDTVWLGSVPHRDYQSSLYGELGGQYQLIGLA